MPYVWLVGLVYFGMQDKLFESIFWSLICFLTFKLWIDYLKEALAIFINIATRIFFYKRYRAIAIDAGMDKDLTSIAAYVWALDQYSLQRFQSY